MQIMIDIPDGLYEKAKSKYDSLDGIDAMQAIANGTPLPKGHGRLIDGDALYDHIIEKYSVGEQLAIDITDTPTVIEADEGGEE